MMNLKEAKKLVKDTFSKKYDESNFRYFIKNLLNGCEEDNKSASGARVVEAFRNYISSYKRIAKYEDVKGEMLDVFVVKVKDKRQLDNARTALRNFIAYNLKDSFKDTALVAFYSDDREDWRFSFVKMDYIYDETKEKITKTLTPAKRYSFLVGENERTHTAENQIATLLTSSIEPSIAEIEDAFNIERVTKEFFERYKDLYLTLKEELDGLYAKNANIKTHFEERGIETNEFAKRLLGQIVFIYFLQKKGWLGVEKNKKWSEGDKFFIQNLYKKGEYQNFFDEVLEPLFYEALASDRSASGHWYEQLKCRIPFLNGGLFEPIGKYEWENIKIPISNEIFGEVFKVFDLYNFTVREDEPLEKEVAVDPEMLGKVFESLLEVKDRKSKGAFYTPREVVHYMCRECLIEYLDRQFNFATKQISDKPQQSLMPDGDLLTRYEEVYREFIPRADIEIFVNLGDTAQENDKTANEKQGKSKYKQELPASIKKYAGEIDKKLEQIKICDPAIGSGAFPVGMMNEIVKIRQILHYSIDWTDKEKKSVYELKRDTIHNCLYGVDIESSAVDIAKLRLWLSLVVDEDEFANIKPLPNLDYKIMGGNSLLPKMTVEDLGYKSWVSELVEKQDKIFGEYRPQEKNRLKEEILEITNNLFQGSDDEHKFNYWIQFYDVMREGGFDVVIGNPPYVRQEEIKHLKNKLQEAFYYVYNGTADLYTYFYARGYELLNKKGTLAFITSNKWMRAKYGKDIRKFLKEKTDIKTLIDFEGKKVFETATVDTNIMIFRHSNHPPLEGGSNSLANLGRGKIKYGNEIPEKDEDLDVMEQDDLDINCFTLQSPEIMAIKNKIEEYGIPLKEWDISIYRGVLTGYNPAFIIDGAKREELIQLDPKSAEIIKPILRGRDIKRYGYDWADLWLINAHNGYVANHPPLKSVSTPYHPPLVCCQ